MAEGKTNMFGKTYNTIGSTDSNFIIKTKGDLKVLWGNKYIDVIKNGKIASEGSLILFVVKDVNEIKQNGVYIVSSEEQNDLWVCIDGIKIQINNTTEENTYVSFMIEQTATTDQRHQALTNIGFYYDTLLKARMDKIKSGIIYVEEDSRLYIAKDGSLKLYTLENTIQNNVSSEGTEPTIKEPLYIEEYSLLADGIEYILCSSGTIKLFLPVLLYNQLLWHDSTTDTGYKLYMKNSESILDIDRINWRKYPNPITHKELLTMMENKKLNPKMYYLLSDFQNPWEVTWGDEPMYYEDQYTEINEVEHLCGKRNAMLLVIQARNAFEIEKLVWSPMNPDWIIYYDPYFKGPEYKITGDDGEEIKYYGYRTRIIEEKDANGVVTSSSTEYLPCKGRITYLKDEWGNEGNFNFRLTMFLHKDGYWRYCVDNITKDPNQHFGEFKKCYNNVFNGTTLDIRVQVFIFTAIYDENEAVLGFKLEDIDSDIHLTEGHALYIVNSETVNNNVFEFSNVTEHLWHEINTKTVQGNKFLNIVKEITCIRDIKNNTFQDIEKAINIEIPCKGNIICKVKPAVIIKGLEFDNNELYNFEEWIDNLGKFNGNKIQSCTGVITNKGTMENNIIDSIKGSILNEYIFSNNTINIIESLTNQGTLTGNTVNSIEYLKNEGGSSIITDNIFDTVIKIENKGEIKSNQIGFINYLYNELIFQNNIIDSINNYIKNAGTIENNTSITVEDFDNLNNGIVRNNTITNILKLNNSGTIEENIINQLNTNIGNNIVIKNNNIDTITESTTISANLYNNTINILDKCTIGELMLNNKFVNLYGCNFTGIVEYNNMQADMNDCNIAKFSNNESLKDISKLTITTDALFCIFNKPIVLLEATELYYCTFEYINNLTLEDVVFYTNFHGNIGNITRELTKHEIDLLKDATKKTDAYPNIRVVCVPEIIKKGMILMWYGKEEIPKGWVLCDGKNGTPNLVGSFIKGDSTTANDPTFHEGIDPETNEFTLKTDHLPKHSHPHKAHLHSFEGTGTDSFFDDYASGGGSHTIKEGEGSGVSTGKSVNTSRSEELEISITIEGNTSSVTSKEDKWQYNDPPTPIKLEPKHFKIIFIMKIDEDPKE